MSIGQKIIKHFAFALAVFLIVTIISTILLALNAFSDVLGLKTDDKIKNMKSIVLQSTFVTNIEIDLVASELEFINGDTFKIETNNNKIKVQEQNGKIEIQEKRNIFVSTIKDSKLRITLPRDMELTEISIDSGAGKISAETINVSKFELDIGAGSVEIENLNVLTSADISGGTGSLLISNGSINNLELEVGVGTCEINSFLTGNNNIEAGVGKLDVNLLASLESYSIRLEKGIGSIKLNKENVTNSNYGSGSNNLNIEAGIGNIEITTIN